MGICNGEPVVREAVHRVGQSGKAGGGTFSAKSLANTARVFATVNRSDETVLTTLASAAKLRVTEFKGQGIANILWACAMVNQSDVQLLTASSSAT